MVNSPGIRSQRRMLTPVAGLWDYDGSCAPTSFTKVPWNRTFSVGIFQWVPRSSKKEVKRGMTVKRITGRVSDPEAVYAKAEAYCQLQEARANAQLEVAPN